MCTTPLQNVDRSVIEKPIAKPTWKVSIIDHPDVSEKFGDLSLRGNPDALRTFFEKNMVTVNPEDSSNTQTVDSFFDIFTDLEASSIGI